MVTSQTSLQTSPRKLTGHEKNRIINPLVGIYWKKFYRRCVSFKPLKKIGSERAIKKPLSCVSLIFFFSPFFRFFGLCITIIFKSRYLTIEVALDTKITDTETQHRKLVQFGDDLRWER